MRLSEPKKISEVKQKNRKRKEIKNTRTGIFNFKSVYREC